MRRLKALDEKLTGWPLLALWIAIGMFCSGFWIVSVWLLAKVVA